MHLTIFHKNDIGSHVSVSAVVVVNSFPNELILSDVGPTNIVVFIFLGDAGELGKHGLSGLVLTVGVAIRSSSEHNQPGLVSLLVDGHILVPVFDIQVVSACFLPESINPESFGIFGMVVSVATVNTSNFLSVFVELILVSLLGFHSFLFFVKEQFDFGKQLNVTHELTCRNVVQAPVVVRSANGSLGHGSNLIFEVWLFSTFFGSF